MEYLFTFALLIVSTSAERPASSHQYRSDYTYDKDTVSFYKMHTEESSSMRAHTVCEAEGAHLMAVESEQDLALIHGMFKKFPDIGNLVLVDGNGEQQEEVDDEDPMINLEEETTHSPGYKQCEVVNREGQVLSLMCFYTLPFICKVNANDAPYNEECDVYSNGKHREETCLHSRSNSKMNVKLPVSNSGTYVGCNDEVEYVSKISLTGSCYRIARTKANWNEAYANCRAEGAHLAILNNEGEFEVVKGLLRKTSSSVEDWQFFVGIHAEENKNPAVFRTVFNQTLEEVGYQPWDNNEPNNSFGVEYCVSLLKTTGKYNDTVCRNRYSYVCEKERRST